MILQLLLFWIGMAGLAWTQYKIMKQAAKKVDYVVVSFMLVISSVLGLLLIVNVPLQSPSLLLEKWVMFLVK